MHDDDEMNAALELGLTAGGGRSRRERALANALYPPAKPRRWHMPMQEAREADAATSRHAPARMTPQERFQAKADFMYKDSPRLADSKPRTWPAIAIV